MSAPADADAAVAPPLLWPRLGVNYLFLCADFVWVSRGVYLCLAIGTQKKLEKQKLISAARI